MPCFTRNQILAMIYKLDRESEADGSKKAPKRRRTRKPRSSKSRSSMSRKSKSQSRKLQSRRRRPLNRKLPPLTREEILALLQQMDEDEQSDTLSSAKSLWSISTRRPRRRSAVGKRNRRGKSKRPPARRRKSTVRTQSSTSRTKTGTKKVALRRNPRLTSSRSKSSRSRTVGKRPSLKIAAAKRSISRVRSVRNRRPVKRTRSRFVKSVKV